MEDNKELFACGCCGKILKENEAYLCNGFFDTYEIENGQYVYEGYLVCEECHNKGK